MKKFEINYGKSVYFGSYWFEDGRIWIDDVHTFNQDEQRVEIASINDKEVFDAVYNRVEAKHSDELAEHNELEFFERNGRLKEYGE